MQQSSTRSATLVGLLAGRFEPDPQYAEAEVDERLLDRSAGVYRRTP
ncbi:MAG: DUF2087 domain-containing protein [Actinobacteria bacterium]|nr:MAG: DUF2087 domain-containing protein [Actinomycetota bacterium]